MTDCLFCKIVAGEIPARQVYADDASIAFLDIAPWQDGHTLIIPRRHVVDVFAPGVMAELAPATAAVGELLLSGLEADGLNLLSNAGAVAGQEVFHAHLHVIPRYAASPGIQQMRGAATGDLDEVHSRLTA